MTMTISRRVRAIEKERLSARPSAGIPHIPLDDGEWLLSLPMGAKGLDMQRLAPDQIDRAEAVLRAAMAAAERGDPVQ